MDTRKASPPSPAPAANRIPATESLELRPGLTVHFTHMDPAGARTTHFAINNSPIIFGFMLAGLNHCRYEAGLLREKERLHGCGSNGITYLPDTCGSHECRGGMHRLSILAAPDFLEPYLALKKNRTPRPFANALLQKKEAFQWNGRLDTQKMRLVSEILANAYADPLRRLFVESRVLDLIGMQLGEYLGAAPNEYSAPPLNASEIRRLQETRDFLLQDLQSPPSLAQLARLAGMNEKKLKSGFKLLFGAPIFTYLRNYRLEVAHELLASGQMNVTEVGIFIGYQSLSHFSQEFRKKYGVPPKNILAR